MMGRTIAAVVVGYIVMAVLILGTFTLAYLAMGPDRAFQPGKYDPSTLWLATSFARGLVSAIVGGVVCAAIARSKKAASILAGVALVLGLLMAIPSITASPADKLTVREATVDIIDAMMDAVQPTWVSLLNPFIGAAGILIGASFTGRKRIVQ